MIFGPYARFGAVTGPIYTALGETIATDSTDFYDGTLTVGIRDEFGVHTSSILCAEE
jgi:hypothetical protein